MTVPASIETVAEFIEVLLQMRLIETVVRSLDECLQVADVRVDMREDDMGLPPLHGIAVVDESMFFQ